MTLGLYMRTSQQSLQLQPPPQNLDHLQDLGLQHHLTPCNNTIETLSPMAYFYHLTGITFHRPLPGN